MENQNTPNDLALKFENELLQDYANQSENLSIALKENEDGLKLMKDSLNEQYSLPIPFPIEVHEFLRDEISFSDFPNAVFYENYKGYSSWEYMEVLRNDFEKWNMLLSKLPTCQSDIEIGLSIMDNYIDEHKNSIWRSQFLLTRNMYVNYPIDGRMRKLEESRIHLEGLILDETDDLKKQILSDYLTKIYKLIYPEYREPKPQSKKIKQNQLLTHLTDNQLNNLFDLLVIRKCLSPTTNKEGFIWAFGGKNDDYFIFFRAKWLKNDNLAVYLVDKLCFDENVRIQNNYLSIAGEIFGIKNPRQTKNSYHNNNIGLPFDHEFIDTIISEIKK